MKSHPHELRKLRQRFDELLEPLNAVDAGERLRRAMASPVKLNGAVKAGVEPAKIVGDKGRRGFK